METILTTTHTIASTIEDMRRQLRDEYGYDFSFVILARGHLIAANNAADGVVIATPGFVEPDGRD